MNIDLVKATAHLNTPTVIQKQCECYEVIAWLEGKRTPLVLGELCIPTKVNIDDLLEVLNANL